MIKPVIKWSGSKRCQASKILSFFPKQMNCYYEPFLGGGAMLYAANPSKAVCGDICAPLIDLWNQIKQTSAKLADEYEVRWERLQREGYTAYYAIRNDFNKFHAPADLLFLSRTCVNGLIRFNKNGEFNNSFHHTRKGICPSELRKIIMDWSNKIQNVEFHAYDYRKTTATANSDDFIYLDPPYFHTKGQYYGKIDYESLLEYLDNLNSRKIKYALSYDGHRGENNYTVSIPKELYKRHELICSGYSTFKQILYKQNIPVFESLYLNY